MQYVKRHYNITKDDIKSGKLDSMKIIEPLWMKVSIYDGYNRYESDLSAFSKGQRLIFAIEWYEAEVCNGGHDQFFYNSTGVVWKDTLEGFKLIGAEKCAENFENVINKFGGTIPFDREERQKKLDEISYDSEKDAYLDIFGEYDSVFYGIDEELENLMMKYIKSNPDEFVFCGDVDVPANY